MSDDFTEDATTQDCPSCGACITMEPYDIGSGPEMSCPRCEWCWGVNGQPLKPFPPDAMRQYIALAHAVDDVVDALDPAVALIDNLAAEAEREAST